MSIFYVLAHKGFFKDLAVTTHASKAAADLFVKDGLPSQLNAAEVAGQPEDLNFGGPALVALFNKLGSMAPHPQEAIERFATRKDGQRRTFDRLENMYKDQPMEPDNAASAPSVTQPAATTETTATENDMATKAKAKKAKKTSARKAATPSKPKTAKKRSPAKGKSAGKVAEFAQVREGTTRQKILHLMTGKHNAQQIADKLSIPASLVSSNVYCLWRDCAIGYSYGENGELTALYPTGRGYADAVKKAEK
jgi:hypothetical protein